VKVLKILGINLLVFAALLVGFNLVCAVTYDLYTLIRPYFYRQSYTTAAAFRGDPGADRIFEEYQRLEVEYSPFIAWKYLPFTGATVNVDADGFRRQPADPDDPPGAATIAFFGGSTVFGMGADDDGTIPALADHMSRSFRTRNYAQTGFNSRQELALLIDRLHSGDPFDAVVFYDGVNDVASLCREDTELGGHGQEAYLRLAARRPDSYLFRMLVEPALGIFGVMKKRFVSTPETPMRCHRDAEHAEAVADTLLFDWKLARAVAELEGHRFLAVLQPVAYVGSPQVDGLDLEQYPGLGRQFEAVYPILRRKVARLPWAVDLSGALDLPEPVYFDFCHLTARGNGVIADRLLGRLETLSLETLSLETRSLETPTAAAEPVTDDRPPAAGYGR
jgi:hypothetical protein